ncbi:class I SAM-dependent methyltransferase [Nocardiopsis nanhaiensis]
MSAAEFDARRYWDERLRKNWSLHGVGMVRLARSYNQWMYRVRARVFRRTVRRSRIDTPNASVLDIGSGTGFYVNAWRDLGAREVRGMDIADSAVEQLRERFPEVPFERADVSDGTPFEDGAFDAVSIFDVLFHIVDDDRYEQALTEIHRVLGAEGRFIFTENFVPEHRAGRKHYVSRSRTAIEDLLHRAGFEVVRRRPAFVFMAPPVASDSRWRWALWSKVLLRLARRELRGKYLGAAMYPFELLLTAVPLQSPVMEIVVCRKRRTDD